VMTEDERIFEDASMCALEGMLSSGQGHYLKDNKILGCAAVSEVSHSFSPFLVSCPSLVQKTKELKVLKKYCQMPTTQLF